jgi:hypothetical protein
LDLDIILEIKDKEKSAKKAIEVINKINGIQSATTNLNF